ncbi:MAG: hypothetical protein QOD26_1145 [Betaproteobacteria bacterium]|nr:hypothetical protein [Betaproteobacteria bacterium]
MTWGRRILQGVDPFATLEDEAGRTEPVHLREVTLAQLRRWAIAAMLLFLSTTWAPSFFVQALAAFGCCIAVAICSVLGAVYFRLGSS